MWRNKCVVIGKRPTTKEWYAILRNDEYVEAASFLKLQKKVNAIRCDVEADGD